MMPANRPAPEEGSCRAMTTTPSDPAMHAADAGKRRLGAIVRPGRRFIAASSWLGAAGSLLWIAQAWLVASAVGGLADAQPVAPGFWLVATFSVLALVRAAAGVGASRLAFEGARRVKSRLREKLTEALSDWSPLDAARPKSGEAAALMADHVEALEPYLTRYEPARFRVMIVPIAIAAATVVYSWTAALVLLVAGPLIPVFMALVGLKAREASERQLAEIGSINGYLADRLRGLIDIRLLGAVPVAADQLETRAERLRSATMTVLRVAFLSSAVLELFSALGVALVAVYVGFHLLGFFDFGAYGARLTLTGGLFILLMAPDFFAPLRDFAAAYHDRASALAAADAFAPVLEGGHLALAFHAPSERPGDVALPTIVLEDVGFAHAGAASPVFDGFSLAIHPGEHVAITGPSGSGKTTLLGLIAGLAPVSAGRIVFVGPDGAEADADLCRLTMTWVGQRPHFLRTTVRRNLTFGRAGMSDAAIAEALRTAAADEVVARLPRGLATMLGETGFGVSGGEAERLAVARAALSGAAIILADEPTAHLDRETARAVADGLIALSERRTLIVATHDTEFAERLGRRIDLGRPAELEAAQ